MMVLVKESSLYLLQVSVLHEKANFQVQDTQNHTKHDVISRMTREVCSNSMSAIDDILWHLACRNQREKTEAGFAGSHTVFNASDCGFSMLREKSILWWKTSTAVHGQWVEVSKQHTAVVAQTSPSKMFHRKLKHFVSCARLHHRILGLQGTAHDCRKSEMLERDRQLVTVSPRTLWYQLVVSRRWKHQTPPRFCWRLTPKCITFLSAVDPCSPMGLWLIFDKFFGTFLVECSWNRRMWSVLSSTEDNQTVFSQCPDLKAWPL